MSSKLDLIFSRRIIVTLFFGFSSGLPLLATSTALQARLSDHKIAIADISLFALAGLPYALKFLWAPLMDSCMPPLLGRRRGWILITQAALMIALASLAFCEPSQSLWTAFGLAFLICFCSASQDLVVDAHRRDTLADEELGLGSALFVFGYRVGMLTSGALALWLSVYLPWRLVYLLLAGTMSIGVITTLFAPEPAAEPTPRSLKDAVWLPFLELWGRQKIAAILLFVLLYRIGHTLAYSLLTPFVLEIGYSKESLAAVGKTVEMSATIGGGLLGGLVVLRLGINRSLWILGLLQAVSVLILTLLTSLTQSLWLLGAVIGSENLISGMATTAFVAYMASLTNRKFSATQYALLTSLVGVPRVILSAPAGWLIAQVGWNPFFVFCALAAVPGMLLLLAAAPWPTPRTAPARF